MANSLRRTQMLGFGPRPFILLDSASFLAHPPHNTAHCIA